MDNTLNRPLFRRREARDRLNDMAGVKGYQAGGPIRSGMEMEARRAVPSPIIGDDSGRAPSGIESALFATDPYIRQTFSPVPPSPGPKSASESAVPRPDLTAQVIETENYGSFLFDPKTRKLTDRQGNRVPPDFASVILRDAASSAYRKGLAGASAGQTALQDVTQGFQALSTVRPTMAGEVMNDLRGDLSSAEALAGAGQEQMDIFEELSRAADKPSPEPPVSRGPSAVRPAGAAYGLPAARSAPQPESSLGGTNFVRPTPLSPTGLPGAGEVDTTADQGPSFESTGRGAGPLITSPTEVAAGLNAPDPAVREKTAADFMQEFMANAPKYEGGDKRLMHAMIGFAIAAGDSPNAMTNIARGLQAGAEMFLKDKAAKDEFDRQLQLSAMQYGLQEVSKERELGRQFTNYVASREVTYRGKTYGPNESVPVLHSDIVNGRMPEGVITEGTSDALMATDAAVRKSIAEAAKAQVLSGAEYRAAIETLDTAAADYASARNLMPLLEASLIRAANGEVTGISAALTRKMNEAMNAVGLEPKDQYESPEAFESALRQVSVTMVQDLLGESGKTISDADRRLIDGLIGLQQNITSGVIKDPDILSRKIQELMQTLESKERNALDTYRTAMEGYGGSYTPSGTPVRSYRAERVFSPEAEQAIPEYVWDQASGRLVIKRGEGQ